MALIDVSNLTFAYPGSFDNIFENVSFQIDTDWRLGFIGRNGRGKTTFLNLLQGKYEYRGVISAGVGFEYFPYEVKNAGALTVDIIGGICPGFEDWRLARELALLEVGEGVLRRPFDTISNGERTKVLLAAMFLRENSFLLIDEPTNHLDMRGRGLVSAYLKTKKGYILVSHDRAFLDGCVDHILSINRAGIEVSRGNFSTWFENKSRRDAFELAENERLKKEVKRLEKTAREKAAWSDTAESRKIGFDPSKTEKSLGRRATEGAKSKKLMKRAKLIESRARMAAAEKAGLLKNLESAERLKLGTLDYHSGRLLSLERVGIFYGENAVCRDVSFCAEKGERICLSGRNGSGKSSILKLIVGEEIGYTGVFRKGAGLKISYVPQDTSFLEGSLSDFARQRGIDESLFKAILRKLDFSREQFDKDMRDFSGGQKKKTLIAGSLCEKAHMLIWDEPLNFIDLLSRIQIEELLLGAEPTVIFVEHDKSFCESVATKTVTL